MFHITPKLEYEEDPVQNNLDQNDSVQNDAVQDDFEDDFEDDFDYDAAPSTPFVFNIENVDSSEMINNLNMFHATPKLEYEDEPVQDDLDQKDSVNDDSVQNDAVQDDSEDDFDYDAPRSTPFAFNIKIENSSPRIKNSNMFHTTPKFEYEDDLDEGNSLQHNLYYFDYDAPPSTPFVFNIKIQHSSDVKEEENVTINDEATALTSQSVTLDVTAEDELNISKLPDEEYHEQEDSMSKDVQTREVFNDIPQPKRNRARKSRNRVKSHEVVVISSSDEEESNCFYEETNNNNKREKNKENNSITTPLVNDITEQFPSCDVDISSSSSNAVRNKHKKFTGRKYSCDSCKYSTQKFFFFNIHEKMHRDINNSLTCETCGYIARDNFNMTRHQLRHKRVKPFACQKKNVGALINETSSEKYVVALTNGKSSEKHVVALTNGASSEKRVTAVASKISFDTDVTAVTNKKNSEKLVKTVTSKTNSEKLVRVVAIKSISVKHVRTVTVKSSSEKHVPTPSRNRQHLCELCNKTFSKPHQLDRHLKIHAGVKSFCCGECSYKAVDKYSLKKHSRVHTREENPYKCEVCDKSFSLRPNYVRHLRIHSGEKPYKCKVCDKSFSWDTSYARHLKVHSGEKPYKCKVCNKSFSYSSNYSRHLKTHSLRKHKNYPKKIPKKLNVMVSEIKNSAKNLSDISLSSCNNIKNIINSENVVLCKCQTCGEESTKWSSFRIHMKEHPCEKPFFCKICSFRTTRSFFLRKHFLTHENEMKNRLDRNGKKSTKQRRRHNRTDKIQTRKSSTNINHCEPLKRPIKRKHKDNIPIKGVNEPDDQNASIPIPSSNTDGISSVVNTQKNKNVMRESSTTKVYRLPLKCEYCSYISFQKQHVVRHTRLHTGEKPFECTMCNAKYSNTSYLKDHIKSKHEYSTLYRTLNNSSTTKVDRKPLKCEYCSYTSFRNDHILRHTRIHTGEKPFECTTCEAKFSDGSNLRGHIKRNHKDSECNKRVNITPDQNVIIPIPSSNTDDISFVVNTPNNKNKNIMRKSSTTKLDRKRFECKYCSYSSFFRFSVSRHTKIHTGEKPFQCTSCEAKFSDRTYLKEHMKRKHNDSTHNKRVNTPTGLNLSIQITSSNTNGESMEVNTQNNKNGNVIRDSYNSSLKLTKEESNPSDKIMALVNAVIPNVT